MCFGNVFHLSRLMTFVALPVPSTSRDRVVLATFTKQALVIVGAEPIPRHRCALLERDRCRARNLLRPPPTLAMMEPAETTDPEFEA